MPATKQRFTWTEVKAGLLVLAAFAVFIVFVAIIYGLRPPSDLASYRAYFSDTLGLNRGADVRFGGAKVGRVEDILLDPEDQSRILVEFSVSADVPINTESVVYVGQTTLTAEKHLEVTTGDRLAAQAPPGSEIPVRHKDLFGLADEVGVKVAEVLDGVKLILGIDDFTAAEEAGELASVPRILSNVDGAVDDVRSLLNENRKHVAEVLQSLQEIQATAQGVVAQIDALVAENRGDIRSTVEGLSGTVDQIEGAAGQVEGILDDIARATTRLDAMADSIDAILVHAEVLSADAQGMVDANRADIEELILDVRETILYVKEFARTISEQPQSVVRGRQPLGRQ